MNIRPTATSITQRVNSALMNNLARLVRAQEQVSSGKRIVRASDDPIGASQVLAFRRQLASSGRYVEAIQSGRVLLDSGADSLQEVGTTLTEARALLVQGLNGTLNAQDRAVLAADVRQMRERLIDLANGQIADRYLFAGTAIGGPPFERVDVNGVEKVVYRGNDDRQQLSVGRGIRIPTTLPGSSVFFPGSATGTSFAGLTGLSSGTSADQGSGYGTLQVRQDGTTAALGSGLALVNGGASDTILGNHTITVDSAAGTVQLDGGTPQPIPQPGNPNLADFKVVNLAGAEVHLDFSGYTGTGSTSTAAGAGSLSLDGTSFVSVNFTETDLELVDAASGRVLHVDTTGLHRSGAEQVTFGGTVNAFDLLQGLADDLDNLQGLSVDDQLARLQDWMGQLDQVSTSVRGATGLLGGMSRRATALETEFLDNDVQIRSMLSSVEDVDLAQAVVEMTRAETNLQLTQATSVRVLQTSLLDFLR